MLLPELMDGKTAETPFDIITDTLLPLGPAKRLYDELVKFVVHMLVMPATSATSERSINVIRRLKN
jgi:hypothetical protein